MPDDLTRGAVGGMDDCSTELDLRRLILGMRAAYARGENAMEFARRELKSHANSSFATLVSYDLQAGSYVAHARNNPEHSGRWTKQIASLIEPFVPMGGSILEAGCGEATTLAGVVRHLSRKIPHALGFDISWSRCAKGVGWLAEKEVSAELYVADLFHVPLEDASIDVVYTSHTIEPNRGRETHAMRELLRVARTAVVMVEPIYELAGHEARARMDGHGYARGLLAAAETLSARVSDYRLLEYSGNPLNPSGVLVLTKGGTGDHKDVNGEVRWMCPITRTPLTREDDVFLSMESGLIYPVLRGLPLLRPQHAVVASKLHGD